MCRSVPQMPAWVTRTRASRGPIFGTGVSGCHQSPGSLLSLRMAGIVAGIWSFMGAFLEIGISVCYSRISASCLQDVNSSILEMAANAKKAKSGQAGSLPHGEAEPLQQLVCDRVKAMR